MLPPEVRLYVAHTICVASELASRYIRKRARRVSGEVMPRNSNASIDELAESGSDPKLTFEDLDGLLGYRLRRAQGAMHRAYMAAVAGLDLTQKQTATLWLIHGNPGVAQVSVAAALGMDRATMMALVDRLEERGLVIRKKSSTDRRRQELYATPAGEKMLRKVKARIATHEARFKALFTPGELSALLSALQKFQDAF
jgi:DNA-binding MarR family transcriptional regulator